MRQLTFIKPGCFEWREVPAPALTNDGEALVSAGAGTSRHSKQPGLMKVSCLKMWGP
ncbi:MAG: hypothetical protein AAGA95_21945 [Pseudomonadota bacterium]